jgi:hypothetical protein
MNKPLKYLTPLQAIRARCEDCCCGEEKEIKLCPADECPSHPFRMGKLPKGSRKISKKTRAAMTARAKQNFSKKPDKTSRNPDVAADLAEDETAGSSDGE